MSGLRECPCGSKAFLVVKERLVCRECGTRRPGKLRREKKARSGLSLSRRAWGWGGGYEG